MVGIFHITFRKYQEERTIQQNFAKDPHLFYYKSLNLFWGFCLGVQSIDFYLRKNCPLNLRFTNLRTEGLISVYRRTSLLSYLQYPVLSKSSTKDLSLSVPERRLSMVLGRSLSLRVNTKSGDIVAFQHGEPKRNIATQFSSEMATPSRSKTEWLGLGFSKSKVEFLSKRLISIMNCLIKGIISEE